jgi:hypothetical protein
MEDIGGNIIKNSIMKTKGLILLLIFCCVSCDISTPFVIDGEKEYVLSNECGTIKIKGSSFFPSVIIGLNFNGQYYADTDLLRIETVYNEDTITNISFRLNNVDFKGKEIEIKGGETLSLYFSLRSTVPNQKANGTILLLPSNFILCGDKPIITDTIRIQLKNW